MAYGLPVITTQSCGKVVTDGVDGAIVPTRDSAILADSIRSFIQDPATLEGMSESARSKVTQFSLSVLGENLREVERRLAEGVEKEP